MVICMRIPALVFDFRILKKVGTPRATQLRRSCIQDEKETRRATEERQRWRRNAINSDIEISERAQRGQGMRREQQTW